MKLISPSQRLIVCVDTVNSQVRFDSEKPSPRMTMNRFIQRVDPCFRRTLFVHTKTDELLQLSRQEKKPLNRYFRNESGRKKCFWIANLSTEARNTAKKNVDQFRKEINNSQTQTLAQLLNFDFDKR